MIVVFNSQGKRLKSIPNDDEFFNYISAKELLEDHPEFDKATTKWSFIIFPQQSASELYFKMKREILTEVIKEAFRRELGLMEVCKGNYENPTWIPLLPSINVGKLKKEWYLDFCKRHGHIIEMDKAVA